MSDQRKDGISWTDTTWGPVRGCSKVSIGCRNCYAESMAARFCGEGLPYHGLIRDGHWSGDVRFVPEKLDAPLRWKRPRRVFVNSMSDLFHESLTNEQIAAVFGVMAACPQHTFQVLTKRAKRMLEWFEWIAQQGRMVPGLVGEACPPGASGEAAACAMMANSTVDVDSRAFVGACHSPWPLPNVHLGVSCENQAAADERIPLLLQCPAAVRWVSAEPLLGAIDFTNISAKESTGVSQWDTLDNEYDNDIGGPGPRLDWVVVGGESGPHARPMHLDWARSIRDQCKAAGVPFHFKQHGEWLPGGFYDGFTVPDCMGAAMNNPKNMHYFDPPGGKCWRVGKKLAGHLLDGAEYRMWPGDKW